MLGRSYEGQNCPAARALEVVGERWSLLIIRDAVLRGYSRFSDFERSLGLAPNILAKRLETFVEAGIFEQRSRPDTEHREYVLTAKGRGLKAVVIALSAWGNRWAPPAGPPVMFEHVGCSGRVTQQLRCATCGDEPKLTSVVARATNAARSSRLQSRTRERPEVRRRVQSVAGERRRRA